MWFSFFILTFQNEKGKDGIYTDRFTRLSSRQSHAVERELVKARLANSGVDMASGHCRQRRRLHNYVISGLHSSGPDVTHCSTLQSPPTPPGGMKRSKGRRSDDSPPLLGFLLSLSKIASFNSPLIQLAKCLRLLGQASPTLNCCMMIFA